MFTGSKLMKALLLLGAICGIGTAIADIGTGVGLVADGLKIMKT